MTDYKNLDYMIKNIMENTQPNKVLKYDFLGRYGHRGVFRVAGGQKKFMFTNTIIRLLTKNNDVKIEEIDNIQILSSTTKEPMYMIELTVPDLLFIVDINLESISSSYLYVHGIHGDFNSGTEKIFGMPLPNIYDDGRVCQSPNISINKLVKDKILNNYFDLCEYFIDNFFNSTFNLDLQEYWKNNIKNIGYQSIYEFLSNKNKNIDYSLVRQTRDITKVLYNTGDRIKWYNRVISHSVLVTDNVINYLEMSLPMVDSDIFTIKCKIGSKILYKENVVEILEFGPHLTNNSYLDRIASVEDSNYAYLIVSDISDNIIRIDIDNFDDISVGNFEEVESITLNNGSESIILTKDNFFVSSYYINRIKKLWKSVEFDYYITSLCINNKHYIIYDDNTLDSKHIIHIDEILEDTYKFTKDDKFMKICDSDSAIIKIIDQNKIYDYDFIRDNLIYLENSYIEIKEFNFSRRRRIHDIFVKLTKNEVISC